MPTATPTIDFIASANNLSISQSVTFTSIVQGSNGIVPTGSASFYNNGTFIGTETLDGTGSAFLTTSFSSSGTESITVNYSGDDNYCSATSSLTENVNAQSGFPNLHVSPALPIAPAQPYCLQTWATDGTNTIAYSAQGLPQGLSINPNSGTVSGTVAANLAGQQFEVTFFATDENGTDSQTVTLTVLSVQSTVIVVNTTEDTPVANVVNGVYVDANGNTSLQCAIQQANDLSQAPGGGATTYITFDPNVFPAGTTMTLTEPLPPIISNISITGPGSNNLTIVGSGDQGMFQINGGTTSISGLTLAGGNNIGNGGAINVSSSGTCFLDSVVIQGCTANSGGAIFNMGTLTVTNSQLMNNTASGGPGGAIDTTSGYTTVTGTTIQNNDAGPGRGGGIAIQANGQVYLLNTNVNENSAAGGGGVYNSGGWFQMTGGGLSNNSSDQNGGGILTEGSSVLTNVNINSNCAANYGGGVECAAGTCVQTGCSFDDNNTAGSGGPNVSQLTGSTIIVTDCIGFNPATGIFIHN